MDDSEGANTNQRDHEEQSPLLTPSMQQVVTKNRVVTYQLKGQCSGVVPPMRHAKRLYSNAFDLRDNTSASAEDKEVEDILRHVELVRQLMEKTHAESKHESRLTANGD